MEVQTNKTKIRQMILCVVFAILSMLILSKIFSSPKIYRPVIESLEKKSERIIGISVAAGVSSALVSAVPEDTMTPIADELAGLTVFFLIILCFIYLEKYLLSLLGYWIFGILVPILLVLIGVKNFINVTNLIKGVKRLLIISSVILITIPIGEKASGMIYRTYKESIDETISVVSNEVETDESEEDGIAALFSKIKEGASNTIEKFKNQLTNFIEAIAILFITDCAIPTIVLVFGLWLVKYVTGMFGDVQITDVLKSAKQTRKKRKQI